MTRQPVPRGGKVSGLQKTLRDHGLKPDVLRELQNARLTDGGLRRRRGFDVFSTSRTKGQQLTKQTASQLQAVHRVDSSEGKVLRDRMWKTPSSYGLIRHHDDFQPKIDSDWSVEMLVTLGEEEPLVKWDPKPTSIYSASSGFRRMGSKSSATAIHLQPRRAAGVFIYDQTIIANDCTYNEGSGNETLPTSWDNTSFYSDTVSLPALAIAYNKVPDGANAGKVQFEIEWATYDTVSATYNLGGSANYIAYPHEAYAEGAVYHIAVTFDTSDYKLRFYIDGVLKATSADVRIGLTAGTQIYWAGQYDVVNGITRALRRDIVLLNECTVRGNYCSTCTHRLADRKLTTQTADWTLDAGNVYYTTFSRTPAIKAVVARGVTTTGDGLSNTWGEERPNKAALSADMEWFFDTTPTPNRLYIYSSGPTNPYTNFGIIELITAAIGGNNHLPHLADEYIVSGVNKEEVSQPNPWACSPPRGTSLAELRWWSEARSAANLLANKLKRLTVPTTNLKGYWYLDDGAGLLLEKVAGRHGSVHHGYPQWVKDDGLLGSIGINFADGQHLIKSYGHKDAELYVDDVMTYLDHFLYTYPDTAYSVDVRPGYLSADNATMMQIRTPHSWQQNLSKHSDIYYDKSWALWDGSPDTRVQMIEFPWLGAYVPARERSHRMTLFSVEGTVQRKTTIGNLDEDHIRIPLLQGKLDEQGYVWFNASLRHYYNTGPVAVPALYAIACGRSVKTNATATSASAGTTTDFDSTGAFVAGDDGLVAVVKDKDGRLIYSGPITFVDVNTVRLPIYWNRATTDTIDIYNPLLQNTVYTITWRMKTEDRGMTGTTTDSTATWMDIFIDDTLMVQVRTDGFGFIRHEKNYDVCVGASYVNDQQDFSVSGLDLYSGKNTATTRSDGNQPPFMLGPVPQHFMTQYQDQPGNFTLGFFRMWGGSTVSDEFIAENFDKSIKDHNPVQFIYNLELDQVTGTQVPSFTRYASLFDMGFKSFGLGMLRILPGDAPTPYKDSGQCFLTWESEDRLGFAPQYSSFDRGTDETECKMLAPYNNTLQQQGGLLAVMDDILLYDPTLQGGFDPVKMAVCGLLNDFAPKSFMEGVVIGDRTIFVGAGGLPRVFYGQDAMRGGLNWGRFPKLRTELVANGYLAINKWYHLRVVYHDDSHQLQAISPPIVFKTTLSNGTVRIKGIPQHPDPRVTSIRVYATSAHDSEALALGDTPRLTKLGALENIASYGDLSGQTYGDTSVELYPTVLELDTVPMPIMTTVASHNGRLVGAGNPLVPDAFFWTPAGNPEKFLAGDKGFAIIEEGTGDRIVKVISAFGSVLLFKANSVWRLDEVQPGADNPWAATPLIRGLGAVSGLAVVVVVDPDTGRSFVFFWSKHGPYLFDGVNFIYLGQPIEQGFDDNAWEWVNAESTVLLHDIREREIIVFLKKTGSDRNDTAYVFNYRYSNFKQGLHVWYEYTGMTATYGLTVLATNDLSLTANVLDVNADFEPMVLARDDAFLPLFSGANGEIYKWGSADYDGHPGDLGDYTSKFTVLSFVSNIITLTTNPGWGNLHGLWMTIIKSDYSDFFIWPIVSNTSNTATPDLDYGALPFNPANGDFLYIGKPPLLVEYPWDDFGLPMQNKDVHRIVMHTDQVFYYRFTRDWETLWTAWTSEIDGDRQRIRVELSGGNVNCESLKLAVVSYEIGFRLDEIGWFVSATGSDEVPQ